MEEESKDGGAYSGLTVDGLSHDSTHYGRQVGARSGIESSRKLRMATARKECKKGKSKKIRRESHDSIIGNKRS